MKFRLGFFSLFFASSSLLFSGVEDFDAKCPSVGDCAADFVLQEDSLRVFVSFSMPDAALLSFSKVLEKTGGTLVFRGIPENSFQVFAKKILELKKQGMGAQVAVDPEIFERLKIKDVPTISLNFQEYTDEISGHVSLRYALLRFSEKGETQEKARELLQQLEGF
jgi:conjugal transfer pilus assembly protein TrbC